VGVFFASRIIFRSSSVLLVEDGSITAAGLNPVKKDHIDELGRSTTTQELLNDVKDLFFMYDDPRMVQPKNTIKFITKKKFPLLRKRFGKEAMMEHMILEFLANSSLRTANSSEASIFVIPFRTGANIIARGVKKGPPPASFGELVSALNESEHWIQGKPHVLLALNTVASTFSIA
jgi:hypothetical protein